jgi:hypothetical protein
MGKSDAEVISTLQRAGQHDSERARKKWLEDPEVPTSGLGSRERAAHGGDSAQEDIRKVVR